MRVLDLFSGIGGFSLGLERAGMETVAFCEIEPFCRKVLNKHWPDVPIFDDVRKLYRFADEYNPCMDCGEPYCDLCDAHFADCKCYGCSEFDDEIGSVDLICGGYPCQPFSKAGKRRGAEDDRHLWPEMLRLIKNLRPGWVIAENVTGHISLGIDQVLADLEAASYTWWTFVIPACSLGAGHARRRVWIVANANSKGLQKRQINAGMEGKKEEGIAGQTSPVCTWWATEPSLVRVLDGVSGRVDRIRSLGNAVVPQIPEIIGKAIMEQQ